MAIMINPRLVLMQWSSKNKATGEISLIYEGTQKEKRNQDVLTDADLVLSDATPGILDQFF